MPRIMNCSEIETFLEDLFSREDRENLLNIALRVMNGEAKLGNQITLKKAAAGTFSYSRAIRYLAKTRECVHDMESLRSSANGYAEEYQIAYARRDAAMAAYNFIHSHNYHVFETIQWHLFCICAFRSTYLFRKVYVLLDLPLAGYQNDLEDKIRIARNQLEHIDQKLADTSDLSEWATLHEQDDDSLRVGYKRNNSGDVLFRFKGKDYWVPLNGEGMSRIQELAVQRCNEIDIRCQEIIRDFTAHNPNAIQLIETIASDIRYGINPVESD